MPTITPEAPIASTFFSSVPVPGGSTGTPDTYVDKASRFMRALGLYYTAGTVPTQRINFIVTANSRCAGSNSVGGRLWSRVWTNGYARWLWSQISGYCFHPADILSRRMPVFDQPSSNWTSGGAASVRSTAGYEDLTRFGFGSYTSTTDGPGTGVVLDGTGDAVAQYTRDCTLANLPSAMADMFGTGGEYADGGAIDAMTGDTLFRKTAEATFDIYYLKGPGLGTWRWEHVTSKTNNSSGTYTPSDPVNTLIDSSTTVVADHTMTAFDSYNAGLKRFTFDTANIAFRDDVTAGMAVFVEEVTTGNFRAIGVIESKTSNTFTLRHGFTDTPVVGDTLHFGTFEIGKESYTMPVSTDDYRGVRITNLTGVNMIIGYGAAVAGAGFCPGTHGWSGNGYGPQMDEWCSEDWFGQLCSAVGVNLAILHDASQSTTTTEYVVDFPANIIAQSPNTEIYLAGDPDHDITGSDEFSDAILAQSTYAGGAIFESQMCGSHWNAWIMGHKDNTPHPNVIGHAESVRPHLNIAANLTAVTISESDGHGLSKYMTYYNRKRRA